MHRLLPLLALVFGCLPEHSVQGRSYDVWTPPAFDRSTPAPVVVLLHGYGVTGRGQDVFFPLSKQLASRRFIYVLPDGTANRLGRRFWNATEACCDFENSGVDDVAYLRALVEDVRRQYQVGRVFLVGHSNGAFMSLRLACEASDVFSGVVAVAGSTFDDALQCAPGRAIPILLNHGTKDTTVPYEGSPRRYPGARETGKRFAARNGCSGTWSETGRIDLLGDGSEETERSVIEGCPANAAVELWTHENTGHLPPYDQRWAKGALDWLEEHAR